MLRDFSSAAQEYTSRIGLRSKFSRKKSYFLLTPDYHILQILFVFFLFLLLFFFFWFDHVLSRVWLFATAGTVACQAPLPMKFSRQKCWSVLLFSNPRDLPKLEYPMSPALAGSFLVLFCFVLFNHCTFWEAYSQIPCLQKWEGGGGTRSPFYM